MKRLLALLIALSAIISFLPAYAAEPAGQQPQGVTQSTSAFTIGEIVVRDKSVPNIEDASTTTEISGEDIAARSDRSLADSLSMAPGVTVSTSAKGFQNFSIRGYNQDRIAILIDGVPLLDPYVGGTNIDISMIPVANVNRIVVNRGASSALYGALGSVGSVNVITKQPEKLYGETNAEYGQHQNWFINASAGAPIGDFFFWINASVLNSNGYEISDKLDSTERRKWFDKLSNYQVYGKTFNDVTLKAVKNYINDDGLWNHTSYRKYQTMGRLGYNITPDIETGVTVSYYNNEQESNTFSDQSLASFQSDTGKWSTPTTSGYWGNPYSVDSMKAAFQNRAFYWLEDSRLTVSPYLKADLGDLSIRLNVFYIKQRNVNNCYFGQDQDTAPTFPPAVTTASKGYSNLSNNKSTWEESSYGFYLMPTYKLADWNKVSASIHYRVERHQQFEQALNNATDLISVMGTGEYDTSDIQAAYLTLAIEDQMNFRTSFGRIALTAGISYDAQDFQSIEQINKTTLQLEELTRVSDDSTIWGTRDSFSPVLAAIYDPLENFLRIRTAFSMKTNFPTLSIYKDIAQDLSTGNTGADVGVEPERIYSYNAGFELFFLNNTLSFRNDYFFTRIDNKIESVYDASKTYDTYINIDGYTAQGLESTLQAKFERLGGIMDLRLALSYVYIRARNDDDSSTVYGENIEETPQHQYIAQVICDFITKTRLILWGTHTRNQFVYTMQSTPPATTGNMYTTEYYSQTRLHDPFMFHIKLQQEFMGHFNVYVMCKNILDDYNADPFNPGPGRMFYFGGGARL